jgi:ABC-type multidrug transport system ATPase subunit
MVEPVLEIRNISKNYGGIRAVIDLSLTIHKGEVFGILGPNGSGKTTTLSIITGIIRAQKGDYRWFGRAPHPDINKHIGALVEVPNFYPYLSLYHNLLIVARIKNMPEDNINRVLGVTNLLMRKYSRYSTLSLGMKQRMGLASVLLGDPDVLVLDEPANGLDPEGIAEVRRIIVEEASRGKTILLASHILDEVEKVCSHVAVLKSGTLLASGKVHELLSQDDQTIISSADLDILYEKLVREGISKQIIREADHLVVVLIKPATPASLNEWAFRNGIVLSRIETRKRSLESQFLELVK